MGWQTMRNKWNLANFLLTMAKTPQSRDTLQVLKVISKRNDKQIEATLVKQCDWHDPQTKITQKVISLYLNMRQGNKAW